MKRLIPLLITAIGGFVLIVAFFIPAWQASGETVAVWFDILASIAFILGGGNLLKVHLQHISDRRAGWGYSVVTLLAFLLTLWFGCCKTNAPPAPNTEYYGESFASLPLEALPEFSVAGTLPVRGDDKPLPASVRRQVRAEDGSLYFRGWMNPDQITELMSYQDSLEWQASVEELANTAQPPPELEGKVFYRADHGALAFRGMMREADRSALERLFAEHPAGTAAVAQLWEASRRETSVEIATAPPGLAIPDSQSEVVSLDGSRLSIRGPMSESLRRQLSIDWTHPERMRPFTADQTTALLKELTDSGLPMSPALEVAVNEELGKLWRPEALVLAINSAGIPAPEEKSASELFTEMRAGERNLQRLKPAGPAVQLNAAQIARIEAFAFDPAITVESLEEGLRQDGDWTGAQAAALGRFLSQQPTLAEFRRSLTQTLLRQARIEGVLLPRESIERLLADSRAQADWQRNVDVLFRAAHVVKFPWSGAYDAAGTPFGWIYEFIFQPLTATMFALLAFYVASAAFRAFRAKNAEAILLLGTAFIILLVQTPLGVWLTAWVPDSLSALRADELKRYIMSLFNTAGNRAIMIGIALGVVATSLKILLGIDRSYLGSGDD